jgi:hypothetical protein
VIVIGATRHTVLLVAAGALVLATVAFAWLSGRRDRS